MGFKFQEQVAVFMHCMFICNRWQGDVWISPALLQSSDKSNMVSLEALGLCKPTVDDYNSLYSSSFRRNN